MDQSTRTNPPTNGTTGFGLHLNPAAHEPLFEQIARGIHSRILSGALPVGSRLPPTRQLAKDLGTHRNTVVRAFEELTAQGVLASTVGRGTYVTQRPAPPEHTPTAVPIGTELPWSSLLSRAVQAEPLALLERFQRGVIPHDAINLTRMQPSADLLPHERFRRCLDHVMRTQGPRALSYGSPREGLPRLREQIALDLERQGVRIRAQDLVITTGSQQALDLIARTVCDPGERILVEGSTYSGALNLFAAAQADVVGVPGDAEGPAIAALERLGRGAKALYLIPNCRNPTGTTVSAARRSDIVAWSHRAGVPVIEDDYAADLQLEGHRGEPALRTLDGQVFYVSTYSKKLIPALRIGFVACPEPVTRRLAALKHAMDLGTSVLLQHALAEFLERGYLAQHLAHTRRVYRERRDVLAEALRQHLPTEIKWTLPDRGVVLWLALPPHLDPERLYEDSLRQGIVVTPGTLHSVLPGERAGLRLTYCAEPPERLVEGARRLGKVLDNALRRKPAQSDPGLTMNGV